MNSISYLSFQEQDQVQSCPIIADHTLLTINIRRSHVEDITRTTTTAVDLLAHFRIGMSVPTLIVGAGEDIDRRLLLSTTVTKLMVPVDMAGVVEDRVNGTQLVVCSSSSLDNSILMIGNKNARTKMVTAATKSHRGCNKETE
jgi:hypothetical protein